jgi:hypothetical protein
MVASRLRGRTPGGMPLLAPAALVATLAAACHSGPAPPAARPDVYWSIGVSAMVRIAALPGGGDLVRLEFDHPHAFAPVNARIPSEWWTWRTRWTAFGTSVQALDHHLDDMPVPGWRAVYYDVERASPPFEQVHSADSVRRAAERAERWRVPLLVAPGVDLVATLEPRARSLAAYYADFLRLGIVRRVAGRAAFVVLQGQGLETDPEAYRAFVAAAAAQAREANPSVRLLAALSASPRGEVVPAADLERAFRATRELVDGYWLSFGSGGDAEAQARELASFLRRVGA